MNIPLNLEENIGSLCKKLMIAGFCLGAVSLVCAHWSVKIGLEGLDSMSEFGERQFTYQFEFWMPTLMGASGVGAWMMAVGCFTFCGTCLLEMLKVRRKRVD